jgi:CRISPR-associated protein Csh1
MIKEICQFVETLEEQAPDLFEEGAKLKEGIYVALDIGLEDGKYILKNVDENGNILKEDIGLFTKKEEITPFFEHCRKVLQNSEPVAPTKIFNPNLKIFNVTCSPYAVGFTKRFIVENFKKIRKDKTIVGEDGILNELTKQYLKKAAEFVEDGQSRIWFDTFKDYLTNNFWILLKIIGFNELKDTCVIVFFLKGPTIDEFKLPYQKYLGQNVFNKADYNAIHQNIVFGISDSLSSFNDKKRFLQHQTASFKYNYRVSGEDAQRVLKFYKLNKYKKLPNPLPVFVDKNEAYLNTDVATLFNSEGVVGYSEIIRSLLIARQTNLQNFYLMFVQKSQIIDIDFVPLFRFKIVQSVSNLMEIKNKYECKLSNVLDLEKELNKVFTKNHRKTGFGEGFLFGNYFTDKVEGQKPFKQYNVQREILAAFYKYRTSIYEYIYKSKLNAITSLMFDDMMLSSIVADISCDEFKDNYHSKESSIKEKLNIWFSLYNFFELNENLIRTDMKQNLKQHREMMQEIIKGTRDINSDEEFAFVAGQTIYYIFSKSVSADKSYSKLEPFLQKTECSTFKQAIVRIFDMYKHENFTNKFGKCMAQVMDYDTDKNIKELTPYMLAGFFAENLLFSDKKQIDN